MHFYHHLLNWARDWSMTCIMTLYSFAKPILHAFDAETAHNMALKALKLGGCLVPQASLDARLKMTVFGLDFPAPVGLAAGFDKNAECYNAILKQPFGFAEVGTITPKAQVGNPKPRMFRLTEDEAVINRLGFNNGGMEQAASNLDGRNRSRGIVGVNIGKNKDTEHALDDYLLALDRLYALSDYITVNISSPNTPGLRDLQHKHAMLDLTKGIYSRRDVLAKQHGFKPTLVKIAPDIDEAAARDIAEVALEVGFDGLIISNTTIARPDTLHNQYAHEMGGLSGKPLMQRSTDALRMMHQLTDGNVPLIGAGGVASAADAIAKIKAGASLVQLYSALVYQGFGLVREINNGIIAEMDRLGMSSLNELIGSDHR